MGKKKIAKKTKELSVAIAESSSISGEQITPRKRGRPRKIVEITTEEVKEETPQNLDEQQQPESKKPKSNEEVVKVEATATTTTTTPQDQPRRSRRKSKPRKSS